VPYCVLPVKNKFDIISPANILYHAMHTDAILLITSTQTTVTTVHGTIYICDLV